MINIIERLDRGPTPEHDPDLMDDAIAEIKRLRDELAQEKEQEPVAWIRWEWNRTGGKSLVFDRPEKLSVSEEARGVVYDPLYDHPAALAQEQQEPVVWLWTHCRAMGMTKKSESGSLRDDIAWFIVELHDECAALALERRPLTKDEIWQMQEMQGWPAEAHYRLEKIVRAIEQAYGIKE